MRNQAVAQLCRTHPKPVLAVAAALLAAATAVLVASPDHPGTSPAPSAHQSAHQARTAALRMSGR